MSYSLRREKKPISLQKKFNQFHVFCLYHNNMFGFCCFTIALGFQVSYVKYTSIVKSLYSCCMVFAYIRNSFLTLSWITAISMILLDHHNIRVQCNNFFNIYHRNIVHFFAISAILIRFQPSNICTFTWTSPSPLSRRWIKNAVVFRLIYTICCLKNVSAQNSDQFFTSKMSFTK